MLEYHGFINTLIIVCFHNDCQSFDQGNEDHTAVLLSIIFDLGILSPIVFRSFWALFLLAILYTMGNSSACHKPSFAGGNDE